MFVTYTYDRDNGIIDFMKVTYLLHRQIHFGILLNFMYVYLYMHIHNIMYRVGQKTGPFLRVDNFATVVVAQFSLKIIVKQQTHLRTQSVQTKFSVVILDLDNYHESFGSRSIARFNVLKSERGCRKWRFSLLSLTISSQL